MPQSKEPKGRKAKEQPDERSKRRGSSPQGPESRPADVTPEVQRARQELAAGPPGQSTFERHAALIGDPRMSQLSNTLHRAMIVRQLQRDYGNRYVQRLVEHISRKRAEAVQTKLTVGPAGDKYEQEADSVAKEVMGKLASPNAEAPQRQGEEEEELQMKPVAQRQEEDEELDMKAVAQRQIPAEGGDVDRELENNIQQAKGGGQALPGKVQSSMEGAFGADFSGVKVHHDTQADNLNDSMSSVAFTTGQDIFFRKGDYNPGSPGGQELLAHELTHVVQQGGAGVQNAREEEAGSPVIQAPENGIRREIVQRAWEPTKKAKKVLSKYSEADLAKVDWLNNKDLRPIIQAYTESALSEENIEFLDAAQKFKSNGNLKQMEALRDEYITSGSPRELNLKETQQDKFKGDPISLYIEEGNDVFEDVVIKVKNNMGGQVKTMIRELKPYLRTKEKKENILKGSGFGKVTGL